MDDQLNLSKFFFPSMIILSIKKIPSGKMKMRPHLGPWGKAATKKQDWFVDI